MENKERQLSLREMKQWTSNGQVSARSPFCGCGLEDSGRICRAEVGRARSKRAQGESYSYNHSVQHEAFGTPDFYFTALMIAHFFQKSAAKKKEVVLPWGACSSFR